jgi:hypothetical protein
MHLLQVFSSFNWKNAKNRKFPQVNSDLKNFYRLFSLLLHKKKLIDFRGAVIQNNFFVKIDPP